MDRHVRVRRAAVHTSAAQPAAAAAAVAAPAPYTGHELPGWAGFTQTYDEYLDRARPGDIVVEVGVCYGKSIAYLAHEVLIRKLDITIYAVDPWAEWIDAAGGGYTWPWPELTPKGGGPFATFCDQMLRCAPAELERIRVLRLRSLQAARIFDDGSLAMVLIDGSHAYPDVCDDIRAWRPKIAPGGLLAGDDYQPGFPGVVQAVHDCIGVGAFEVAGGAWRWRAP